MEMIDELAAEIARRLVARRETVAVSESSTGGLISAALLRVPGASAYYCGGAVVYTVVARSELLGIDDQRMAGLRSASEPYVLLTADTIRSRLRTTWGLAEAGAAGPEGNRYGDPAGHTCLAVVGPLRQARTLRTGIADRAANMLRFAEAALALFRDSLK
ncbi:MAG: CinA family protein [Alphaproteobacteria bacterium]|nr:CinA family protein [Alphaproteobacteria bacterium]